MLVKTNNGGSGLYEDRDEQCVFVQNVVFNEPAYLNQRLKTGDRILAISHYNQYIASGLTDKWIHFAEISPELYE